MLFCCSLLSYVFRIDLNSLINKFKLLKKESGIEKIGLGNRVTNRARVGSNRVLFFRVYENQPHLGIIKVWFSLGSGFVGFRSDSVAHPKPGYLWVRFPGFSYEKYTYYPTYHSENTNLLSCFMKHLYTDTKHLFHETLITL